MKKRLFILLILFSIFIIPKNAFAVEITSSNIGAYSAYLESNPDLYWSPNHTGSWANWGSGHLYFTFSLRSESQQATGNFPFVRAVYAWSNGTPYTCTIGTTNVNNSTHVAIIYSAVCPMSMGSNGLENISFISGTTGQGYGYYLSTSGTVTFEKLSDTTVNIDTSSTTNAVNNQTNSLITNNNTNTNKIIEEQNKNTEAIKGIDNTLKDDNVSSDSDNSSTANSWASKNASDNVVSDLVLMPINFLRAFNNGFSSSCSSFNLGSLYGHNIVLPCINISNFIGSALWSVIDILMSGFLILGIAKKFVKVFNDFTNLKDSQVDELYGGGNNG